MNTLRADLLTNRLETSHPRVLKGDFVKAWHNGNHSSGAAYTNSSFGISSIIDGNAGGLSVNFSSPFESKNYCSGGQHRVPGYYSFQYPIHESQTGTYCPWNFVGAPGGAWSITYFDSAQMITFTGDLA